MAQYGTVPDVTGGEPGRGFVLRKRDDPPQSNDELVARRKAWFDGYISQRNVFAADDGPYTCPCCGHPTLDERGGYEICHECGWEDDGQDDHDSATVRGGPNGSLSLDAARAAYIASGGVRGNHVPPDPPTTSEWIRRP